VKPLWRERLKNKKGGGLITGVGMNWRARGKEAGKAPFRNTLSDSPSGVKGNLGGGRVININGVDLLPTEYRT